MLKEKKDANCVNYVLPTALETQRGLETSQSRHVYDSFSTMKIFMLHSHLSSFHFPCCGILHPQILSFKHFLTRVRILLATSIPIYPQAQDPFSSALLLAQICQQSTTPRIPSSLALCIVANSALVPYLRLFLEALSLASASWPYWFSYLNGAARERS